MEQQLSNFTSILKKPTAFIPILMSLTALAFVLIHIAIYGAVHEADEGTAAHLWQILMAGQFLVIIIFAARWFPRAPRESTFVLALQLLAALAAMAPIFLLGL
jgi:hypothetical protein